MKRNNWTHARAIVAWSEAKKNRKRASATGMVTYEGPGRNGDVDSFPKSSFSEFLRDPGTE